MGCSVFSMYSTCTCFFSVPFVNDVIFTRQGLGRGAKQPFPSLGTFISTLSQRRDAGGRGLSGSLTGTLSGTLGFRHGEFISSTSVRRNLGHGLIILFLMLPKLVHEDLIDCNLFHSYEGSVTYCAHKDSVTVNVTSALFMRGKRIFVGCLDFKHKIFPEPDLG